MAPSDRHGKRTLATGDGLGPLKGGGAPSLHLSDSEVERLLLGTLPREARRGAVRHLLRGCRACGERLGRALRTTPADRGPEVVAAHAEAIRQVLARVLGDHRERDPTVDLAVERIAAPGLVAMLTEGREPQDQRAVLASQPRFHTWGVVEALIEESLHALWRIQPEQSVAHAEIAVAVAEHLSAARYGERRLNDLKARAFGCLGNALRNHTDFPRAAHAFSAARYLLEQGTGDPLERAGLVGLEASLETDLGYFDRAIALLSIARAVYQRLRDNASRARIEVKISLALVLDGRAEAAVRLLETAEAALDRCEEPRWVFSARQIRIAALCELGRGGAALELYEASRGFFDQFRDPWTDLRLRWVESRIASELGKLEEAEAMLGQLWTSAFARGLRLEVALISLDIAALYVQLGRYAQARRLAGRLIPLFKRWGVHRRALEAWRVLQQALQAETATVALVRRIAAYLRRGWCNPEIPFSADH